MTNSCSKILFGALMAAFTQQAVAQVPVATLTQDWMPHAIQFEVHNRDGRGGKFLGAVLISLTSAQCPYGYELPPLLCDSVVLAAGYAEGTFSTEIPIPKEPLRAYLQGVVIDSTGLHASVVTPLGED